MRFIAVVAALASIAVAADVSVVTCPDCKTPASTNDIVTREPIPTTKCDSPTLTVVKPGSASSTGGVNPGGNNSGGSNPSGSNPGGNNPDGNNPGGNPSATGGQPGNPTSPPITAGAGRVAGGALAAVVAVVALL